MANLDPQGFEVIPGLLDPEWIRTLKQEQQRFAKGPYPLGVQTQLVHRSRAIRDFVSHGPQIELAKRVLGPNVCFTHQQFIAKQPDERKRTDVPWHQDNGYGELQPPNDLTVWITLDDCDERNGCLWVLPKSQERGLLKHEVKDGLMGVSIEETGIPIPLSAGDAIIFQSLMLHRSLPNETDQPRIAMYVRYCTPNVTMVTDGHPVLEDPYSWMVCGEAD